MNIQELIGKSNQYRKQVLKIIYESGAGHTGGSLSILDILNVLYNRILKIDLNDPARDRFIQSKGHSVEALYVVLADQGFFPFEDLKTMGKYNSPYIGHPTKKIPGMEQNTGGLGHGLPISAGTALAAKMDNLPTKVFTVLGDGEMAEGSNWEGMMMAAHYKLDNLCAILDYNKLQITGPNYQVMGLEPLRSKIESFGWEVEEVDGHNIEDLVKTLEQIPFKKDKPSFIIAHTVKGKGISFMENEIKWHHGVPSDVEYELAMKELNA
ncbi:MAG: hypothetical protein RIR51_1378 [Bacteroidota bacterium]|jgi:transketolase